MSASNEKNNARFTLSDEEIGRQKDRIRSIFDQFGIGSEILDCRLFEYGLKIDISIPDGMRLKELLSFRDDIDIRLPDVSVKMEPDFLRAVVVITILYVPDVMNADNTFDEAADELFVRAGDVVVDAGMASTGLLQRKMKIGYARASRLIDDLEAQRIIGPFDGKASREILVTPNRWAEMRRHLIPSDT